MRWVEDRRPTLENTLLTAMFGARLDAPARFLNRHRAVLLMYHGFTDKPAHDGIANHEWKHLPAREFRKQLAFLAGHYNVVHLEDVVRAATDGASLPPRPAVITMDDGYRSIYEVAYPLLKEFRAPAAVFLATKFVNQREYLWTDRVEYAVNHAEPGALDVNVGNDRIRLELADTQSRMAADRAIRSAFKRLPQDAVSRHVDALERSAKRSLSADGNAEAIYQPLEWNEIREMAESGLVSFGAHSHSHVILTRCTEQDAADELRTSRRIIEDRLGRRCDLFCYPNGRRGDFNSSTKRLVKESGYSCALTTVYGMNPARPDVYELKRYNLGKRLIPGEIEVRLAGLFG
jgi:peptidoglycan/xylan/chitin deacetylase (PgdA/CDA1 family)